MNSGRIEVAHRMAVHLNPKTTTGATMIMLA